MTAIDSFRKVVREVIGPALRAEGFKGSGRSWVLTAPNSDRALVNIQSSTHSTRVEVEFLLNLAVIPDAWLAWRQHVGLRSPKGPHITESVWRGRLFAGTPGREQWWVVRDDASASVAAEDVVQRLGSDAVPRLRQLLDRRELLASLRRGDPGVDWMPGRREAALAVLLADEGDSEELVDLLGRWANSDVQVERWSANALRRWMAERANGATSSK